MIESHTARGNSGHYHVTREGRELAGDRSEHHKPAKIRKDSRCIPLDSIPVRRTDEGSETDGGKNG